MGSGWLVLQPKMEFNYQFELATKDTKGTYLYDIDYFDTLMQAANHACTVLRTERAQIIINRTRTTLSILREIGFSEDEIYDITGDVNTAMPSYGYLERKFRNSDDWSYCIGSTTPNHSPDVPLLYIKITKVKLTPRPTVDTALASFESMRV